jgi:hypothetical protein
VTDAEATLEAHANEVGRRRLAKPGPRAAVGEPHQTEAPSQGLVDLDAASENLVPTARSGRPCRTVPEPGPEESESAPKASRPRMSGSASQAEVVEPKAKAHRRRLGDQKTAQRHKPTDRHPGPCPGSAGDRALRARQSLLLALLAGLLIAAAGAALWYWLPPQRASNSAIWPCR